MSIDYEAHRKATNDFIAAYNADARQALALETTNNAQAADKHVSISALTAKYFAENSKYLSSEDSLFLRNEIVKRCLQALVLRSMQLSGFADLAVSIGSMRDMQADIDRARRRLDDARSEGDGGLSGDGANVFDDPRTHTNGLYEFIPYEQLDVSLSDLPGYESQHRQVINAYFVINTSVDDAKRANETLERKPRTRAGANVILYGPPGTGKTAAARGVARSLGLNLAFVNAENLLSAYRSETEKNLRTLYEKMRQLVRVSGRNVVLLLDEVDGLVKNRSNGAAVTSGEYSLLTRFLTILEPNDGKDNYGVFSIFTTNRLTNLDDAFRRRCTTVLLGYVDSQESRVRLFDAFLYDLVDYSSRDRHVDKRIGELCKFWVPGDYARFKRSVLKPYQLDRYLRGVNLSYDEFIIDRMNVATSSSDRTIVGGSRTNGTTATAVNAITNREIVVNLPLLTYDEIAKLTELYSPITPSSRYHEYLNDDGETSNANNRR